MADWSIPKRYLRLTLYSGSENTQSSDNVLAKMDVNVNVSFSTSAAVYGQSPEANISIIGLKPDKIAHLATSYNAYAKNRIFNSIRIDAGYDNKHGILYTGTIIEATPNLTTADYNINLKCISYWNYQKHDIISKNYDGKKDLKEICSDLAKKFDLGLDYNINEKIEISDFGYRDSNPVNIMRNLANTAAVNIWLESAQSEKGLMVVAPRDDQRKGQSYVINAKNMIGAPVPTAIGCDVDVRMDSSIQAGIPARIESIKFPILNSLEYFINSFSHSGQTKGNKWVTHLSLTRRKLYEK